MGNTERSIGFELRTSHILRNDTHTSYMRLKFKHCTYGPDVGDTLEFVISSIRPFYNLKWPDHALDRSGMCLVSTLSTPEGTFLPSPNV